MSKKLDCDAVSSDGDLPKDIDFRTQENLNKLVADLHVLTLKAIRSALLVNGEAD